MLLRFGTSSRVKAIKAVFRLDESALGSIGLLHNEHLFWFTIVAHTEKLFRISKKGEYVGDAARVVPHLTGITGEAAE
jgi:hypothetical protein